MKNVRRAWSAVVLALVLVLPAAAGEIGFPGATNSPPPSQPSAMGGMGMPGATAMGDMGAPSATAMGDMGTPGATAPGEIPGPGEFMLDPVTEFTLRLLQSVISLF